MIKTLIKGLESERKLELLLSLTGRTSETLKAAVVDYLAKGHSMEVAAALNGIDKAAVSRCVSQLEKINTIVEEIKVA